MPEPPPLVAKSPQTNFSGNVLSQTKRACTPLGIIGMCAVVPLAQAKSRTIGKQSLAQKQSQAQPASQISEVVASLKDLEPGLASNSKLEAIQRSRTALKRLIRGYGKRYKQTPRAIGCRRPRKDLDGRLVQMAVSRRVCRKMRKQSGNYCLTQRRSTIGLERVVHFSGRGS